MSMEQGAALLAGGRFHEAMSAFGQALRAAPDAVEPRLALARTCIAMQDAQTAVAWLSDACRVAPQHVQAHAHLGNALLDCKLYAQALAVYRDLHDRLGARDATLHLHYGFCLEHLGALDEAVTHYRASVAANPQLMEAHVDLAGVLWRISDFEGALAHARTAVALAPDHPFAVRILGTALLNLNRLDEAEHQLRRAIERKPGFAMAELDLAFTLLLGGKLSQGWAWYHRRWADTERLRRPDFFQQQHEWRGPREQPPRGKRIAVYAEQGLGDVIQFARYVPLLQRDGASVVCVVQPALASLVEHSMPGVQCLAEGRSFQTDMHAALLDLPMHYGTTLETIPSKVPYLHAPPDKVAQWRQKLAPWDGKRKVGIAWSGFLGQVNNRNRAIALGEWRELLEMEGVQCFSLQKGDAGAFTDIEPASGQLVDFTGEWHDFTESAAMLENLDLVITVDTGIAHLAGALGRPTWTLLAPNADWRWLLERDDSPWYPAMRLFRREFGEERAAQMGRVAGALREVMTKVSV